METKKENLALKDGALNFENKCCASQISINVRKSKAFLKTVIITNKLNGLIFHYVGQLTFSPQGTIKGTLP